MTEWNSPATLATNAMSFSKFIHALLGIYAWEWAISLDFDIAFLTGKRKFRWPMIFYIYGRYGLLGLLIGFVVILDIPTEVNCMIAYRILAFMGNTVLGVASINLFIRTMAIWGHNRYIVSSLVLLSAGHFAIILRSITNSESNWVDGSGCVTSDVETTKFAIMYIYTMVFDLIILILTGYKLWSLNLEPIYNSAVMKLLFRDGLVYFIVAFTVNAVAVIFSLMNFNPIMAIIADFPATTFGTIVAGRVVRRLSNHVTGGQEISMFAIKRLRVCQATDLSDTISVLKVNSQNISQGARSKIGVHIKMATFTERDDERSPSRYKKGRQVQQSDPEVNEPVIEHKGSAFH